MYPDLMTTLGLVYGIFTFAVLLLVAAALFVVACILIVAALVTVGYVVTTITVNWKRERDARTARLQKAQAYEAERRRAALTTPTEPITTIDLSEN